MIFYLKLQSMKCNCNINLIILVLILFLNLELTFLKYLMFKMKNPKQQQNHRKQQIHRKLQSKTNNHQLEREYWLKTLDIMLQDFKINHKIKSQVTNKTVMKINFNRLKFMLNLLQELISPLQGLINHLLELINLLLEHINNSTCINQQKRKKKVRNLIQLRNVRCQIRMIGKKKTTSVK